MDLEARESDGVDAGAAELSFRLNKILVPVDFSPASRKAFTCALPFAREYHSELTLLHVLEPAVSTGLAGRSEVAPSSEKEFTEAKTNFCAFIAADGDGIARNVRWTLRSGLAADEIIEAARDADIDLIVIATHGFTSWKYFCIGRTAQRVAHAAPCPVLVVREKEHEFAC